MKALKALLVAILGLTGLMLFMWLSVTFEAIRVILFFTIIVSVAWLFAYVAMYGDDYD